MSHFFADIRNHERFLDVTLAADTADGSVKALRAHKVILSACSPFMPIMLYLRGISARDLNHVLEFIYKGSLNCTSFAAGIIYAALEGCNFPATVISRCFDTFPSNERIMERCSRTVRFAVRCIGTQAEPILGTHVINSAHSGAILDLHFSSPDSGGNNIYTASTDNTVTGISLFHDGANVLTNAMDNMLRIWDICPFAPEERCVKIITGRQ